MRNVSRVLFSYALTLLLIFSGVGTMEAASAQSDATPGSEEVVPDILFAVYPEGAYEGVYFEEFVEPGASHQFSLALQNAGAAPLGLLMYPADAYSMTNGGMGVNFQDQERTSQTTWLDFPEGTVELQPGEELLTPFTVTVPEGTAPGQYVTAIGVETDEAYAIGGEGGSFSQIIRKVIAVVIIVPGEAEPGFQIGEPQLTIMQGQTGLQVPIENTGNVRVRPTGMVQVTDADGNEIASGEITMGSVYMGHTAPFEIWLPNAVPVGEYLVSVDLTDPDTGVSASIEKVPVTVVPEATPEPIEVATPIPATPLPDPDPVGVTSVEIMANSDPIQFASVAFDIENNGNHLPRTRVILAVSHNGELVEEFVIENNLPLPVGTASVEDRYIPPTGWESGTWTFSIKVVSINTNENVETVVVSEEDVATIEVP